MYLSVESLSGLCNAFIILLSCVYHLHTLLWLAMVSQASENVSSAAVLIVITNIDFYLNLIIVYSVGYC